MIDINDVDIDQIEQELGLLFDEPRRNALKTFNDVQACPGSGKTTMVGAKLLLIARQWKDGYRGVCVLTHTNVAKEEIVSRLEKYADGSKLLAYPHFIGTIQEFVNKFLAIPYLRSKDFSVNHIDDEICCNKGWNLLKWGTRSYLERKHITSLQDLQWQWIDGELKLNIPGFPNTSTSSSYKNIESIKTHLMDEGYFYYNEMYALARDYLESNPELDESVRSRFPVVLIDEMQDTKKFQDELLNNIFNHQSVQYQRFGDPDQAIYSGDGEENETYNMVVLDKIENSHRFGRSIAILAKNLSFNRINLMSLNDTQEQYLDTIFLVDDNTREKVFQSFAELCAQAVPSECLLPIKSVGAVGIIKDDGLTIRHYHRNYDKNQSSNSFRPSKLIHYFYRARRCQTKHDAYRIIFEGIVKCGQFENSKITHNDGTTVCFSLTSLRKYLKESEVIVDFNFLVNSLQNINLNKAIWDESIQNILNLASLNILEPIGDFIGFETDIIQLADQYVSSNTISIEVQGRKIVNEVTTIHSVKGETHAATLVLETKFHQFDAGQLIDNILGQINVIPERSRKSKFMKQLYVAFSRPKYLLCLTMDKSRFPQEHIGKATFGDWNIYDLTDIQ